MLDGVQSDREYSFAELRESAGDHLQKVSLWQAEGLSQREIGDRVSVMPRHAQDAVTAFQRLSAEGVPEWDAEDVATEVAAMRAKRAMLGAPEQAEVVALEFDSLTRALRRGTGPREAIAEFRGAVVGWRGEGVTGDTVFGQAILVDFGGGDIVPDGREIAGIRETGPRHELLTPHVHAGIEAYLDARRAGMDLADALETVPDTHGTAYAVADLADIVDHPADDIDPGQARERARAMVVADAAIGQFLSLRGAGMDIDQAAMTAAGGDRVAVHAIGWFVAGSRAGANETLSQADAVSAAVAGADAERYEGLLDHSEGLPGFAHARARAAAALAAEADGTAPAEGDEAGVEAVRRHRWLTGHGMDPATAARLAAVDAAEEHAQQRRWAHRDALIEAEHVLDAALERREDPAVHEQATECEQAMDALDEALQHTGTGTAGEDDAARAERLALWNTDELAGEQADDDTEGWGQQ
ncbi:hypothetical protein D5S19_01055 [Amycolatopsis panacis]|uniref:Uncharacterized protein n=2 Tax=Amycolatopsis panacis TaxID=2340917 RepID=A0A419IBM2_9PSEU|nr:hypothetical protein D5S19_01055 [Amycolatopsis panacis]